MALTLARSSAVAVRPAAARPAVFARPAGLPVRRAAPLRASGLDAEQVNEKVAELVKSAQKTWEKTDDKPAAVAVTAAALVALITASSVADTIDRIPIISDVTKLIGIGVTGWFIWRWLIFGPDREELVSNIKAFVKKVYGA